MREAEIAVINPLGLHARAAAQLVRLSCCFRSKVTIARTDDGMCANAKSILSVLTLAASIGTALTIAADGDDEADAIEAITSLFANGFGEL